MRMHMHGVHNILLKSVTCVCSVSGVHECIRCHAQLTEVAIEEERQEGIWSTGRGHTADP